MCKAPQAPSSLQNLRLPGAWSANVPCPIAPLPQAVTWNPAVQGPGLSLLLLIVLSQLARSVREVPKDCKASSKQMPAHAPGAVRSQSLQKTPLGNSSNSSVAMWSRLLWFGRWVPHSAKACKAMLGTVLFRRCTSVAGCRKGVETNKRQWNTAAPQNKCFYLCVAL